MWLLMMALLFASPPAPQPAPAADQLAAAIQKRYDAVRDFTVKFTQTYEGGLLRKRVQDRGTLQVKRPGKMR